MYPPSKLVSALFLIFLSSTPSFAEFDDRCPDSGDVAHFLCTKASLDKQDARINAIYNHKRAGILGNKSKLHEFVEDEKAWIKIKEEKCRKAVQEMDVIGRTADIVFNDCEIEETIKRIDVIK